MTIDDTVKLMDAAAKLLGVLAWPVLIAIVAVRFAPSLREFFANLSEFSVKGGGFEASAKRIQAEAAAALVAATVARPEPESTPATAAQDAKIAAQVVAESVTPRVIRHAANASVLWVDDHPSNNDYERQALEALGVRFVLANSTDEALAKLKHQKFQAIISDMSRPPDDKAGYTLLDRLRNEGDRTPFIIYAGPRASADRSEARRRGALGSTNRADELFSLVVSAISAGR